MTATTTPTSVKGRLHMFTLTIETDNAAFGDTSEDALREIARILYANRARFNAGNTDGKLLDVNGNTVGRWELTR